MTLARPETRYAEADGVRIGYQCWGSGKRTVIGVPGASQNIDVIWENAEAAAFLERLGSMCRVIHFDKRGTGVSDRGIPPPSLDARVQDLVAVMRAEAVDRAIVAGWSEGGTLAAFFAATYPERAEGLILSGASASFIRRDDHPWAPSPRTLHRSIRLSGLVWGTGELAVRLFAPSMRRQPGFRRWAVRYEHASISRRNFVPFSMLLTDIDIRDVLPSIYAPTLVMHARGDRAIPIQSGRYLAEHIVGARFVELPTADHAVWFGARDVYLDAMQEFLTGTRPNADHSRRLATILFTDIVDSTVNAERAATPPGATFSTDTTTCAASRSASAEAAGSRAPVTDYWRHSTARAARSVARGRFAAAFDQSSGSRYVPGCTRARSRHVAMTWPG